MKGYVEKQIVDLGDHGEQIEQYGIFESTERAEGNVIGIFSCEETRIMVKAFMLDEEEVMVRFRPERTGIWEYRIQAGETILREGSFLCIQAGEGNHGPVSAAGFGVRDREGNLCRIHKEAADPSMIFFKGSYYLFPSMSAGFYTVIRQIIWSRFRQFIWMCSQVQIAYWSG